MGLRRSAPPGADKFFILGAPLRSIRNAAGEPTDKSPLTSWLAIEQHRPFERQPAFPFTLSASCSRTWDLPQNLAGGQNTICFDNRLGNSKQLKRYVTRRDMQRGENSTDLGRVKIFVGPVSTMRIRYA